MGITQRSIKNGGDKGACVLELESLPHAVRPARPAGVQQPHNGIMLLDATREPFGIDHGRTG